MTVTSIKDAWTEAGKILPTDYEYSAERSERAGYPIYYSTAAGSATKEERRETAKRILDGTQGL